MTEKEEKIIIPSEDVNDNKIINISEEVNLGKKPPIRPEAIQKR